MTPLEILAAVTSALGVISFAVIFTLLYRGYAHSTCQEVRVGKRDIDLMDEYIYDMQPSVKTRNKIWKIVKSVLFYGFLALIIPLCIFSIVNKIQGSVSMVGNRALMVVASGSMSEKNQANDYIEENGLENQFDQFDMILLERVEKGDLRLYDVIAFRNDEGINVIHRIIKVNGDGSFVTRGDSNNRDDDYHPTYEDVIGRYVDNRIPLIGSLVMFFQTIGGIVTLISLVYCILMLERYNSVMREAEEARLDQLCSAIELDLDSSPDAMRADFVERLYYKGFVYLFNDQGFVDKEEITDEEHLEKSNSAAIRVKNENGVSLDEEIIIIETEREDEEPS